MNLLEVLLEEMIVVEINENLIDTYAQIDSYSQHRNSSLTEYSFNTPRNMGKNDLWIASTSALLDLRLITTDGDFDHLKGVFFDVQNIKPSEFNFNPRDEKDQKL